MASGEIVKYILKGQTLCTDCGT